MKKILLSLPYGMSARNMLRSGVYKTLREEAEVVVLSPLAQDTGFVQEFAHPHTTFVSLPRVRSLTQNIIKQLLFMAESYWFTKTRSVETLQMLKNQLKRENPIRYFVHALYGETIGGWSRFRTFLEHLYHQTLRQEWLRELFKKNHFDVVFLTHGYMQEETAVGLEARRCGVPVVNMIHSWDNITSKSGLRQITNINPGRMLPVKFVDYFVVWNEILEQELHELYGIPNDRIFKSGIPQFDSYVNFSPQRTRDQFLEALGADPKRKLIYFLATSTQVIHDQTRAVKALIDAVRSDRLAQHAQLLIRFHPGADMSSWKELFQGPHVFFQEPTAAFQALAATNAGGWKSDDKWVLPESICHCDVLINGISTTAIEGAIFDKPVVCFAFDGDLERNQFMKDYCSNTHYKKLLALDGIRVAWDEPELLQAINNYLRDPNLDQQGREAIRVKECYLLDGKAGERIGRFLLELPPRGIEPRFPD